MSHLIQISVNPQGGVPKYRVAETFISVEGVQGDKQRNRKFHGGPQRAVCLYSHELIRALQDEGHPIDCGRLPGVRMQQEIPACTSICDSPSRRPPRPR